MLSDLYSVIRDDLACVQCVFDNELFSDHPFINELCTRIQRYHGKMLRPALVLLFGEASENRQDAHLTLAAVVEMVHLATLVHDDVLDEADIRRQHPTVNATHGNETAVLLGDYLISHAYNLCSSLNDQFAARAIASTTNTVCEGELLQVSQRNNPDLTEGAYFDIIRGKTASLTSVCCGLGARYAGVDSERVTAASDFGMAAGVAFQIVDDVLDIAGTQRDTGKTTGRDLAFGNATLPIIHCLATGRPETQARMRAIVSGQPDVAVDEVQCLLTESGSLDFALQRAREFVDRAIASLRVFPRTTARESLEAMCEFILRRHF